jgi:programmed cell death 6-interacting protein
MASIYASLGAAENRAEIEGIKRALAYMQVCCSFFEVELFWYSFGPPKNAAGVFSYIRNELLPILEREQASFNGIAKSTSAGQDLTTSFLGALEKFCLAEAQECFWQRAVLEKYKNGLIAKLAIQVRLRILT